MFPDDLLAEAGRLLVAMRQEKLKLATAESCTGGLIAGLMTEVPGSSDVVERGFVSYSNAAKIGLLGVRLDLLLAHGAVSAEVAQAMAEGALRASAADVSIAVTGIAGPGGGSPEKPVGLVFVASARRNAPTLVEEHGFGAIGRSAVRLATIRAALTLVDRQLRP